MVPFSKQKDLMNMPQDDLKERLFATALARRAEIKHQLGTLAIELQVLDRSIIEACLHEDVVEGAYVPHEFGFSQPPFAVCRTCGYAEEGWGAGYWKLHPKECVSRDAAMMHVVRRVYQDEMRALGRYGIRAPCGE